MIRLLTGDCREVLATLDECSVDAIVTDPPYGIGFMGKEWDTPGALVERKAAKGNKWDHVGGNHNPSSPQDAARTARVEGRKFQAWCETWAVEALRVLKPGGHLLAFGGTRTYHRMVCAIEDAGFEIRDCIAWVYGSGFPKSLDVAKAIDKDQRGAMVREKLLYFARLRGVGGKWLEAHGIASAASFADWTVGGHVPGEKNWQLVKVALQVTPDEEAAFERAVVGRSPNGIAGGTGRHAGADGAYGFAAEFDRTAPATDAARQWEGWGTALKPAHEPIVVARRPLSERNVAANVLRWGTGAINVDGCRVRAAGPDDYNHPGNDLPHTRRGRPDWRMPCQQAKPNSLGRWPANLAHDGSDEVLAAFPQTTSVGHSPAARGCGGLGTSGHAGQSDLGERWHTDEDKSAARFFYCAKASKADRGEGNTHPTVKPTDLMRWLVRLVTPPGGVVLDPFAGSGSTLRAAELEGFSAIGVELLAEHVEIARRRIGADAPLFAEVQA